LSYTLLSILLRAWCISCPMLCSLCYGGLRELVTYTLLSMLLRTWRVGYVYFVIDVIEDLEGEVSYSLLSVLLRTWNVSCLILFYRCYRGLGGLVVLYFALYVMEDLER
jgi:hypothetical protein